MQSWKARLALVFAAMAMLVVVSGPAMAQDAELLVDEDGELYVCFEDFADADGDGFLEDAIVCYEVDGDIDDFEDFDEDGEGDDEDDDDGFDFSGDGSDED